MLFRSYGLQRISQAQGGATSYYLYDGGGTVRGLANAAGAVTDTFTFDGFGNLISRTGTTANDMLYRGEQFDAGLGFYYLRARWYNPVSGRFLTTDKYEGDDSGALAYSNRNHASSDFAHHLYEYGEADPVSFVDPTGRGVFERSVLLWYAILNSPQIQRIGHYARGLIDLAGDVWLRAGYWYGELQQLNAVRAQMNTVASGTFLTEAGQVVRATAVTANRWVPALRNAIERAGEIPVTVALEVGPHGINDAEQLLLRWGQSNNYRILAIAPAGQAMCPTCVLTLTNASMQQVAEHGYPIMFPH